MASAPDIRALVASILSTILLRRNGYPLECFQIVPWSRLSGSFANAKILDSGRPLRSQKDAHFDYDKQTIYLRRCVSDKRQAYFINELEHNIFPMIADRTLLALKLCFFDSDNLDIRAVSKLMEVYTIKLKYKTDGIQVRVYWDGHRPKDWTPGSTAVEYPEMLSALPSLDDLQVTHWKWVHFVYPKKGQSKKLALTGLQRGKFDMDIAHDKLSARQGHGSSQLMDMTLPYPKQAILALPAKETVPTLSRVSDSDAMTQKATHEGPGVQDETIRTEAKKHSYEVNCGDDGTTVLRQHQSLPSVIEHDNDDLPDTLVLASDEVLASGFAERQSTPDFWVDGILSQSPQRDALGPQHSESSRESRTTLDTNLPARTTPSIHITYGEATGPLVLS